ncbi:hypothetical protein HELRODRAFT_110647 [Helobdella robusta]|uniref:Protein farnesyltransferase/geranylgeranyltransferase type-1 subunit alpha n=1 Tax=Helobdella robusta TaxID=6412 RepID=T1EF39_HELRO|nr:hypothetical protein HELRODRAFT_110647 [Helobdella robusta]ESO07138.1 hypothetical protein HELRODRAFT_110647 [Helobdella robusta]
MDQLDSAEDPYVFYRERQEWKDVTPVSQDDGPFTVVQIAYSDKFKDVFDYFRAILKSGEISERAFDLTTDAAGQNPANYTVWRHRRLLLKELNKDLNEELDYISEIIEEHPKNYQVWYHRSVIVLWLNDASKELKFIEKILKDDAKNYHAWQHRQWILTKFNLWENELEFVSKLIKNDVRNNSAWNQRYFVIAHTTGFTDEVVQRELEYTTQQILKVPHNESPWNYLRGILSDKGKFEFSQIMEFCDKLYKDNIRSFYLLGFMVECLEDALKEASANKEELLKKALQLCDTLIENDTIRVEYWNYISRSLSVQHSAQATA